MLRTLSLGTAVAALTVQSSAQTLEDLRNELRQSVRQINFASGLVGLVLLSDELELSASRYSLDVDSSSSVTTLVLPFHTTFEPWGEHSTGLYIEGVLGYARAKQHADDLYGGAFPAIATTIDTNWSTFGALAGVGLAVPLTQELVITPVFDFGLAHIDNRTDYGGPGAAFSRALADGIIFNWDALAGTLGGAARVEWLHPLDETHRLEVLARYDLRTTDMLHVDDPAQNSTSTLQLVTARVDLTGPTGWNPLGHPLDWRLDVGYRNFLAGDLFGITDYFELGGALELGDCLPLGSGVTLRGSAILGENVTGWSAGLGFKF